MIKGFTTQRVIQKRDHSKPYYIGVKKHYTYDEDDMVFYRDDVDDDWFMEVPTNGIISYTLKAEYKSRLLVKIDK